MSLALERMPGVLLQASDRAYSPDQRNLVSAPELRPLEDARLHRSRDETDSRGSRKQLTMSATSGSPTNNIALDSPVASDPPASVDDGLSDFLRARPRLFGLVYRILGSVAEAEDVIQDVWTRWQSTDRGVVRDP